MDIKDIQRLCEQGKIRWTIHVLKRLILRGISQEDTVQAIRTGEIIEQYPEDYPYPSCLISGTSHEGKTLHVVCGIGDDNAWMITAYYPDPAEWENDFKTRKKAP